MIKWGTQWWVISIYVKVGGGISRKEIYGRLEFLRWYEDWELNGEWYVIGILECDCYIRNLTCLRKFGLVWFYGISEWTWERWQWNDASHSLKFQHYWSLTIRLFSVISRTLVGWVFPLCKDAVGAFYSPSWLGHCLRKVSWSLVYIYIYVCVCVCVCVCSKRTDT